MNVFYVTRHLKTPGNSISWITIAENENCALKELNLKKYGRKFVKVREATNEEILAYMEDLKKVDVYTEQDSLTTPLMLALCQSALMLREEEII